jgi:hypothetical protein
MKVGKLVAAIAFVVSVALVSQAYAAPQLDFGVVAPTGGTISYAGGATPLMGSGITVDNVVGLNTPANNNFLAGCVSCVLNFTTGNFTGASAIPPAWNFGPGGTISVVGGVDFNNDNVFNGNDIPAGTTLLSGTFNGPATVLSLGGNMRIAGGAFLDIKDADLAAFYGLNGGTGVPYSGFFNLSFNGTGNPGDAFTSSQVLSGDIVNEPVDLPSSLLLLGSGLAGLAYLTVARGRQS